MVIDCLTIIGDPPFNYYLKAVMVGRPLGCDKQRRENRHHIDNKTPWWGTRKSDGDLFSNGTPSFLE